MPRDRWTTYGDLATVIGSGAMAVGAHVSSCTHCTDAWRVLQAKGTVSPGFTWSDPSRQESVTEVLEAVGISFTGGKADPGRRASIEDLRSLVDAERT